MTIDVKSAALAGGVTLEYVEYGNPDGSPLLLLHGLGDSWRSFLPVLPHLPRSIRSIAVTQRGHGDSSRPSEGYRARDLAADAAAFLDALQVESAIILGHSIGSVVAARFAIDHPERTIGLVLEGGFASTPTNQQVKELWNSVVSTMIDPVDPGFVRDFQHGATAKPIPQPFFETVVEESLKLPAHVWRGMVGGLLQDDMLDELSGIDVPTLILWGDQDATCPRSDQDQLTTAIDGSRLIVYPGVGHAPHWEVPERFASDVATFVGTTALR